MSSDQMTEDDTLVALKDMIASRGWELLMAHAKREHGPEGYGRTMQAKLSAIPAGPDRAFEIAQAAELVDSTARAVNALMEWPAQQIRALTPKALSTRAFAAMRRA